MSNELALLTSGVLVREVRRGTRIISRVETNSLTRQAGVEAEAEVALAKIDVHTMATGASMGAVGRVAQAQLAIEQLAPQASARLNMLADHHALAVAAELDLLQHRMRHL